MQLLPHKNTLLLRYKQQVTNFVQENYRCLL
jgi:hypothetical protein